MGELDDDAVEENEREGVDLVLLVLLTLLRSVTVCGRPEMVCARTGTEVEGRYLGTAGKASRIGVTCGGESLDASDIEEDATERRASLRLGAVGECGADSGTARLCDSDRLGDVFDAARGSRVTVDNVETGVCGSEGCDWCTGITGCSVVVSSRPKDASFSPEGVVRSLSVDDSASLILD